MRGHPATVSGLLLLPLLFGMTLGNRFTAVADLRGGHGGPARSTGAERLTALPPPSSPRTPQHRRH
ncbi:hypothetical protein [Streptomyces avermitilis]|uniref:hypothetical protein n=1 Tax=Streptomyces avermitilis TaxID=33903 RepID=UPI000A9DF276|nr:hypothetical protein [Streptomyces avermitilis]